MSWPPHITVGTIVQRNDTYLMIEEKADGAKVFNQPAGHLEPGETLIDAALRETREETAWEVELTGMTGIYLYYSASADITYQRVNFLARPVRALDTPLDDEIVATHWLTLDEIRARPLRSDIVLTCIEDARRRSPVALEYVAALALQPRATSA